METVNTNINLNSKDSNLLAQSRGCRRWNIVPWANVHCFGRVPSDANPRSPSLFGNGRWRW
ncbi:MAG: hypothetical protein HON04_16755 [Planctomicrobium sp.]|nr:hypothetical protein [Planctomicrobium sp.]